MLTLSIAALATTSIAAPVAAVSRFETGSVYFSATNDGGIYDVLPGTLGVGFGYTNAGGCEFIDDCIISVQDGQWSLAVTDTSAVYEISAFHSNQFGWIPYFQTSVWVVFSAPRQQRLTIESVQSESSVDCSRCGHSFDAGINQYFQDDRWWIEFSPSSFASTPAGFQWYYQKLSLTMTDVPEPATWAMLVTGFGLVGATLRRRRNLPYTRAEYYNFYLPERDLP